MSELPDALKEIMNLQRKHSRAKPEGPFENADVPRTAGVSGEELSLFLDFIEALGAEAVGHAAAPHRGESLSRRTGVAILRSRPNGGLSDRRIKPPLIIAFRAASLVDQ